jgi:hypothetical protein
MISSVSHAIISSTGILVYVKIVSEIQSRVTFHDETSIDIHDLRGLNCMYNSVH